MQLLICPIVTHYMRVHNCQIIFTGKLFKQISNNWAKTKISYLTTFSINVFYSHIVNLKGGEKGMGGVKLKYWVTCINFIANNLSEYSIQNWMSCHWTLWYSNFDQIQVRHAGFGGRRRVSASAAPLAVANGGSGVPICAPVPIPCRWTGRFRPVKYQTPALAFHFRHHRSRSWSCR